jgi:hypothetical protein
LSELLETKVAHFQLQKFLLRIPDLHQGSPFSTSVDMLDELPEPIMGIRHDHLPRAVRESGHDKLPKGWELAAHGTLLIKTDFVNMDQKVLKDSCALRQLTIIPGSKCFSLLPWIRIRVLKWIVLTLPIRLRGNRSLLGTRTQVRRS